MAFGIQIIGADRLAAAFGRSPLLVAAETRVAMTKSCLLVEGHARTHVRYKSGGLAGSISHRISGGGANLTGEIGPSKKYGLYVEKGTKPHWMPPGILPFPAMRSIAKKGTKAYPFMKPAYDANAGRITKMFEDIGFKVVQGLAG